MLSVVRSRSGSFWFSLARSASQIHIINITSPSWTHSAPTWPIKPQAMAAALKKAREASARAASDNNDNPCYRCLRKWADGGYSEHAGCKFPSEGRLAWKAAVCTILTRSDT
jgi:hypothetical protein